MANEASTDVAAAKASDATKKRGRPKKADQKDLPPRKEVVTALGKRKRDKPKKFEDDVVMYVNAQRQPGAKKRGRPSLKLARAKAREDARKAKKAAKRAAKAAKKAGAGKSDATEESSAEDAAEPKENGSAKKRKSNENSTADSQKKKVKDETEEYII